MNRSEIEKAYQLVLENIKPGKAYSLDISPNNVNNNKLHILGVVDGDMWVYKFWGKYKQRWFYHVDSFWFFYYHIIDGHIRGLENLKQE